MDDDGSGYADVGEEEDWSAEPGADENDQQAAKRQKTADAKKGGRKFAVLSEVSQCSRTFWQTSLRFRIG